MRILPGVVAEFNVGESVSFGGGGNNTQGYTVNGIRSSGNTVSLDGSSLIDIGSNSGVIVSLNNDMVQEVKVQSSNFAAEYGTGGMNVSGVTKSGTLEVPRLGLRLLARHRFAANDRSNSIAGTPKPKSTYQYPGGNIGGPIVFGDSYTKNRDRLFFFVALRSPAPAGRLGLALHAHVLARRCERRLQRAAREPRLEPEQHPAAADPAGLPRRRAAGAEQRHAAVHHADRPVPREPVPAAELQRSEQPLQLRLQPPGAARTATTSRRASTGTSATTRRPTSASRTRAKRSRARAACGGRPADVVALPTPNIGENRGRSYAGNIVIGAEPDDDERGAGQLQPADARQPLPGSAACSRRAPAASRSTASSRPARPARTCRPTSCTGGAATARSATCGRRRNDMYRAQRRAAVQQQADEAARARTA